MKWLPPPHLVPLWLSQVASPFVHSPAPFRFLILHLFFSVIPRVIRLIRVMMSPSEKVSAWSSPVCGRAIKLVYDHTGATMYCDRPISLHVCRGRNKDPAKAAQNKGHWYEACTQPQPEGPHFHRWRYDLPREKLLDKSGSDFNFSTLSAGQFSFQDLLNIPITPESCSPVSSTFNPSPFLTPTRRRIFTTTTTPTKSPPTSNHASIFPGVGSSLVPSGSVPSPLTVDHPPTRTIINTNTGKAVAVCNGPVCRSNKAKPPTRNAKHCTHKFCKKCCISFQTSGQGGQCSLDTHAVPKQPVKDVAADIQPEKSSNKVLVVSNTSDKLDEYDRNRPFSAAHYSAKDIRQRQLSLKTDELIRKQVAKESLKQSIELLFWKVSKLL